MLVCSKPDVATCFYGWIVDCENKFWSESYSCYGVALCSVACVLPCCYSEGGAAAYFHHDCLYLTRLLAPWV